MIVEVMGRSGTRFGEAIALTVANFARPIGEVRASIDAELSRTARGRAERYAGIVVLAHGYAIDPGRRVITITNTVE